MFGYSRIKHKVFTLSRDISVKITPGLRLDTKFLCINELKSEQYKEIKELQGQLSVTYLKWRYCSPDTYVLLAYFKDKLAHVEWIVPARKIRGRYPFVNGKASSIISCLTHEDFRGKGIYPSQLQEVVQSDIQADLFWIWTAFDNKASLKGIYKAGGKEAGEAIQRKWLWGLFCSIKYFS
jgi:hypothetical protein